MEKTNKRSEAMKKYWSNIPKLERSEISRKKAIIKNSKMTKEQRLAHSKKMILALKLKLKKE